jgi:hypothetical protein
MKKKKKKGRTAADSHGESWYKIYKVCKLGLQSKSTAASLLIRITRFTKKAGQEL